MCQVFAKDIGYRTLFLRNPSIPATASKDRLQLHFKYGNRQITADIFSDKCWKNWTLLTSERVISLQTNKTEISAGILEDRCPDIEYRPEGKDVRQAVSVTGCLCSHAECFSPKCDCAITICRLCFTKEI